MSPVPRRIVAWSTANTLALALCAQPQWTATLPPVAQDGYYTIVLSPEVVGRSKADLGDLRVVDPRSQEVPYVLEREPLMHERTWMRTYTLLRNERLERSTIIEMEADSASVVDELIVHVRNARVEKRARITGSDDRTNWFMIQDECLAVGEGEGATSVLRFVDLPLSDYRYYRIELNDRKTPPVQVLELGHSARARSEGRYTAIDGLSFTRTEDRNTTRIALFGPSPFRADRLVFAVNSEVPYARNGAFAVRSAYVSHERKREVTRIREERIGTFFLASHGRGVVSGPGRITDTLWITIENLNDRPLEIGPVSAFQLQHRLIARLKAGIAYRITTGDAKRGAPRYDMQLFRDSIAPSIAQLDMPPMSAIAGPVVDAAPAFAPGIKWVWAAIIGIGAIVALSALRLLRRSSSSENPE